MTSLAEAPNVLGWDEPAVAQIKLAARIAEETWGVPAPASDSSQPAGGAITLQGKSLPIPSRAPQESTCEESMKAVAENFIK